ncbi:MAG TPA: O-antigen ligase family protein [Roseiflexaceae bacterium]|nr:O-antigen ligase family protein [Roseiflexaceae bacterium]
MVLAVLGLWAAGLAIERRLPRVPRSLVFAALALLLIFFTSAASAPAWRIAALKFCARQAQGALLALCLADQLATWGWPIARRLGLGLIGGAAISALLGVIEIGEAPPALALLAIFKEQPTMAGGLLRLSATFAYANIAAMYYEATLPICLAVVGLAARGAPRRLLGGTAVLLGGATLLTYSRAALLTAAVATVAVLLGAIWLGRRLAGGASIERSESDLVEARGSAVFVDDDSVQAARRVGRLCMVLLALLAGVVLLNPAFRVRVAAPDVADWYRADYAVAALPGLAPNEVLFTPVTILNRGLVTWRSAGLRPVALSYHWLDPQTRRVVRFNGRRTLLSRPVEPGDALSLNAEIQAPEKPGDYVLAWDMVVEHSGWFSERGNSLAEVAVRVAGRPAASQPAPRAEPANMPQQIIVRPAPPPRSQLWDAAVRMWRARPLLGIGPDVFRHAYGPELGLRIWDDRLHTNSLYLELLVGAGVAGLAAFLLLIGAVLWPAARLLTTTDDRRVAVDGRWTMDDGRWTADIVYHLSSIQSAMDINHHRQIWMALGCAVALLTFLVHGLLDMFLEYSATNLLLWALLGGLGGLTVNSDSDDRAQHMQ